jgi:outer membrane lipoprotein-sorting protein
MRRIFIMIAVFAMFAVSFGWGQTPTGEEILQKVDANITSENKVLVAEMIVRGRRGTRTLESKSWIEGTEKSFTEYLAPARERGTKMLKLKDQLWLYSPSTDRTIMISGHMLRQSVMGSDLSYEDMMEDPKLMNLYTAEVVGEETYLDRPCWILELTAKSEEAAYFSRKIWVDRERYVVLKENRYAKGGKLLKTTEVKEVEWIEKRWVPKDIVFKDALKSGEGTEFILKSIEFGVDIPEYTFTKASLRK